MKIVDIVSKSASIFALCFVGAGGGFLAGIYLGREAYINSPHKYGVVTYAMGGALTGLIGGGIAGLRLSLN